jgi:hypothetical protein
VLIWLFPYYLIYGLRTGPGGGPGDIPLLKNILASTYVPPTVATALNIKGCSKVLNIH